MESQRAGNVVGSMLGRFNDLFGPSDYRSNGPQNSPLDQNLAKPTGNKKPHKSNIHEV
ncbi:hypothetical protein ABTD72_12630 [Acinetobacter baumannii]